MCAKASLLCRGQHREAEEKKVRTEWDETVRLGGCGTVRTKKRRRGRGGGTRTSTAEEAFLAVAYCNWTRLLGR